MSEDGLLLSLSTLKGVDLAAMDRQIHQLLAIKAWAIKSLRLGYEEGDRVQIISWEAANAASKGSGWYPYREALAIGQEGRVEEISFNAHRNKWQAMVALDRCWGVGEKLGTGGLETYRYWYGPADETPDGFEQYKVKEKVFAFNAHWVGPL